MSTAGGKDGFVEGTYLIGMGEPGWVNDFPHTAPDMAFGRDFDAAPMPVYKEGSPPGTSLGGWTLAIPAGVTDPARRKAAVRFILWLCASPEGTAWKLRGSIFIPGWRGAKGYFDDAGQDGRMKVYLDIVRTAKHYRPPIPIGTFLNDELDRAGSRAIEAASASVRGLKPGQTPRPVTITPQQALDEATANAQRYLDRFLQDYPPPSEGKGP